MKTENEYERLQTEYAELSNQHSSLTLNANNEIASLQSRLRDVESDRDRLKGFERRAQGLSIELEEEKRKADEGRRGREDDKQERGMEDVVRKELRRWSI